MITPTDVADIARLLVGIDNYAQDDIDWRNLCDNLDMSMDELENIFGTAREAIKQLNEVGVEAIRLDGGRGGSSSGLAEGQPCWATYGSKGCTRKGPHDEHGAFVGGEWVTWL